MGLDRVVRFPAGGVPAWDAIKAQLARVGESAVIRMIDGLPAFPDETPEVGWRELRIAAGSGMVTLRQTPDSVNCVVWSNADATLLAARDRAAWACAEAGGGVIEAESGAVSPSDFAQLSDIRPV